MAEKTFQIQNHFLVPKHEKITEAEKKKILEQHNIFFENLPKIFSDDPAIVDMRLKSGDVVKISRVSPTAGETIFYRGVVGDEAALLKKELKEETTTSTSKTASESSNEGAEQ